MRKMVITKKHKGSTLPEVMIALTITSFCATLAVVIYMNIQQSTLPFIKIKASELANKYLTEAVAKNDFMDDQFSEEEYTIKKEIVRNMLYTDCKDLTITVFDVNKKKLAQLRTTLHAE